MVHADSAVSPDQASQASRIGRALPLTLFLALAPAQAGGPEISITDVQVVEGDPGDSTLAEFRVTLSQGSAVPVTVDYETTSVTAIAFSDYVFSAGTIAFDPHETVVFLEIEIVEDLVPEPTETFRVLLSNPVNALITNGAATGTILDDEDAGAVSVADPAPVLEGDPGDDTSVTLTVTLSEVASKTVQVSYTTSNVTAVAFSDYVFQTGVVTFLPGETVQEVVIELVEDLMPEPPEVFRLNLSSPVNTIDPVPVLERIEVPMLAIFGGADRVVPVEASVEAMVGAFARNERGSLTYRVLPGADHGLQVTSPTGRREPAPGLHALVLDWVVEVTGAGRPR